MFARSFAAVRKRAQNIKINNKRKERERQRQSTTSPPTFTSSLNQYVHKRKVGEVRERKRDGEREMQTFKETGL